jgi:hypothetical protein
MHRQALAAHVSGIADNRFTGFSFGDRRRDRASSLSTFHHPFGFAIQAEWLPVFADWRGSSVAQRELDLLVLHFHPMNVQQLHRCAGSLTSSIQSTLSIVPNLCS